MPDTIRGRNSQVVGIRLPNEVVAGIKYYLQQGQTVSSWVKDMVIDSVNAMDSGGVKGNPRVKGVTEGYIDSVNTTKTVGEMDTQAQARSVNTTPDLDKLRQVIRDIEDKPAVPEPSIIEPIPIYVRSRHKEFEGKEARARTPGGWKVMVVPALDMDGNLLDTN